MYNKRVEWEDEASELLVLPSIPARHYARLVKWFIASVLHAEVGGSIPSMGTLSIAQY